MLLFMKVSIMEKNGDVFSFFREVDLASIPTKEDKIILDIDGVGYVFHIHEVHYADNQRIDIRVYRGKTILDYDKPPRSIGYR